jgi:hypothetical protein
VLPANDLAQNYDGRATTFLGIAQLEDAAGHTSNIGDKAYAELAAAIGTLCNRVLGSGNTTPDLWQCEQHRACRPVHQSRQLCVDLGRRRRDVP